MSQALDRGELQDGEVLVVIRDVEDISPRRAGFGECPIFVAVGRLTVGQRTRDGSDVVGLFNDRPRGLIIEGIPHEPVVPPENEGPAQREIGEDLPLEAEQELVGQLHLEILVDAVEGLEVRGIGRVEPPERADAGGRIAVELVGRDPVVAVEVGPEEPGAGIARGGQGEGQPRALLGSVAGRVPPENRFPIAAEVIGEADAGRESHKGHARVVARIGHGGKQLRSDLAGVDRGVVIAGVFAVQPEAEVEGQPVDGPGVVGEDAQPVGTIIPVAAPRDLGEEGLSGPVVSTGAARPDTNRPAGRAAEFGSELELVIAAQEAFLEIVAFEAGHERGPPCIGVHPRAGVHAGIQVVSDLGVHPAFGREGKPVVIVAEPQSQEEVGRERMFVLEFDVRAAARLVQRRFGRPDGAGPAA